MKIISSFLKFFGILIVLFVVFSLPLALLARNIGELVFSSENMLEILNATVLDSELMADIATEAFSDSDLMINNPDENSITLIIFSSLTNLEHEEWVALINMIAPPELISETIGEIIVGYYQWLDNDSLSPSILVNVGQWKNNVRSNAAPVFELVLNTLPLCTAQQLVEFSNSGDLSTAESLPLCLPPEPFYSSLINVSASAVPARLDEFPDVIDLGTGLDSNIPFLSAVKQNIRLLRSLFKYSWLAIVFLYFLAIPLGTRSIKSFFYWSGFPLLLAGVFLMIAAILTSLSAQIINFGSEGAQIEGIGAILVGVFNALAGLIVSEIAKPLYFQAGLLLGIGVVGVVIGMIMPNKAANDQIQNAHQSGMVPKPEPFLTNYEDSEKPTGKFG